MPRPLPAPIEFLKSVLAKGPLSPSEIEARARAEGILNGVQTISGSKLFKRAKNSLGIRSVRTGFGSAGGWLWILDQQPHSIVSTSTPAIEECEGELLGVERRAAIPWEKEIARLSQRSPPNDVPRQRWQQFLADCNNFLGSDENWARRAAELGWDGLALFGCHRDRPLMYLGSAGLVWAINGGKVTKLEHDWAVIELPNGSQRVFHRRSQDPKAVTLPWIGLRQRARG